MIIQIKNKFPLYQWIIRYVKYIIDNKIYDNMINALLYTLCNSTHKYRHALFCKIQESWLPFKGVSVDF